MKAKHRKKERYCMWENEWSRFHKWLERRKWTLYGVVMSEMKERKEAYTLDPNVTRKSVMEMKARDWLWFSSR